MNKKSIKPGTRVYVSDTSDESAIENECSRIYIAPTVMGDHYCVADEDSEYYVKGEDISLVCWRYVVPVTVKTMTLAEIEAELGYPIKIKE